MATEIQYDCEGCAAALSFAPGTTSLVCQYCGRHQEIEVPADDEKIICELDFHLALAEARPGKNAEELIQGGHEVRCEDCGSQSVLVGQAGHCPFCDSPVVVEMPPSNEFFSPESVLPFQIERSQAQITFRTWVKSRWFAPNDLEKRAQASQIDGVYMPYWTYDSRAIADYSGQRGVHYYTTVTVDGKDSRVRKTRWHGARGEVQVSFDDVLVYASSSLPRKLIEKLEPWDLSRLAVYDSAYLSGFIAERYSIDLEAGFHLAEKRMMPKVRQVVRQDIGGDEQRISHLKVEHSDLTFKHCLLPLWISSFRYNDKVYRFIVNAQTGEITGERPYSVLKIVFTILFVIAFFAGLISLSEM